MKLLELRNVRQVSKMTQLEVARLTDLSKQFYSQLELGTRRLSYRNAMKIANVFGMKPDELFYKDFLREESMRKG